MNKKIISFIVCFILFISLFSIVGFATDISKIQPDYPETIIILQPYHSTYYVKQNNTSGVVIMGTDPTISYVTQDILNELTVVDEPKEEVKTEENKTEETTIPEPVAIIENKLADEIYNLVNKERTSRGLNTLAYNFKLQEGANIRAKEASQAFSHTRPDGTECYTVFPEDYNVAGENLIMADEPIATAENLMATWMESQGHKDNILAQRYTSIAIGIYEKDGIIYASQLFVG